MKIAIIGQKGIPALFGGIERHVEELAVRLADRGHDVTVYTRPYFTPASKKSFQGVRLVSLRSIRTKHFDAISHTLFATIHAMRQEYDVIHYHGVGPSLVSFLPRIFRTRASIISTFHCVDRKHKKWGPMARFFLRLGEWIAVTFPHKTIGVSKTIQRYCRAVYGKEVTYIPNGVPIQTVTTNRSLLKKFGLESDEYIVCVSRLIPHKGVHYLIEAFRNLKTKKKLVIVGDGFFTDGYVQQLRDQAAGDDRIIFTGFQKGKALADLFAGATLFVLPSENEGLPIALLEAASYGLCILASDIPENMEVIRRSDYSIGFSFQNGNPDDLRRKLEELLRKPKTLKRIGEQARELVARQYNWDDVVTATERLYSKARPSNAAPVGSWRRVLITEG